MTPKPFSLDVLSTHKCFFLLDQIPASSDIAIKIVTPDGDEDVDFVDLFTMADGRVIAAWHHPMQKLPLHNLVASAGEHRQIVNINNIERVLPHFDRPVDATNGAFLFTNSVPVPNGDWRCDRGMYGAQQFVIETQPRVFNEVNQLIVYENLLTVNSVAAIVYIESRSETARGTERINNSVAPTTTRTFQEMLRLVWEWSQLVDAPFNSTEEVAVAAHEFLKALNLTAEEEQHIASLPAMQISRFLEGAEDARKRPDTAPDMTSTIENLLFSRMASSSLSLLITRNPDLWNLEEVLNEEKAQLAKGINRFKEYYGIDANALFDVEAMRAVAIASKPLEGSYIDSQLKQFDIKLELLQMITSDNV